MARYVDGFVLPVPKKNLSRRMCCGGFEVIVEA
jgi:uncharacterized protein YbaA (DUF1428 family)